MPANGIGSRTGRARLSGSAALKKLREEFDGRNLGPVRISCLQSAAGDRLRDLQDQAGAQEEPDPHHVTSDA